MPVQVDAAPRHSPAPPSQQGRRAIVIAGNDNASALEVSMNVNVLLTGVDDGLVTLEQKVNEDLAVGAAPGVAGNIKRGHGVLVRPVRQRERREGRGEQRAGVEDVTGRAGFASLLDAHVPHPTPAPATQPPTAAQPDATHSSAGHTHDHGP